VPIEQVSRAADFIGTLDPRPASRFASLQNHYVTPDVVAERQGGAAGRPSRMATTWPNLRISNADKDMLADPAGRNDVRDYIRDKHRGGVFLIRSIHRSARPRFKKSLSKF